MAYKFKASDRTVQRAVRRIAREQIDGALHAIDSSDRDTARHEVRKACKKIRALVRLIRPSFSRYARENGEYRDIAGLLAYTMAFIVVMLLIEIAFVEPLERRLTRWRK